MTRHRRPLAALALIALIALLSACGSSAPAATGSAGAATTHAPSGVTFAKCMRSHGVSNFPDPGASGTFTLDGIVNGSSLDPNAPAFRQAMSACKSLEPAGFTGRPRSSQQQSAALTFARCIRANGVPDFPDPINGQPLVDTNLIPSSATSSGMSLLQAAMQKCSRAAAAAGVTR